MENPHKWVNEDGAVIRKDFQNKNANWKSENYTNNCKKQTQAMEKTQFTESEKPQEKTHFKDKGKNVVIKYE